MKGRSDIGSYYSKYIELLAGNVLRDEETVDVINMWFAFVYSIVRLKKLAELSLICKCFDELGID